MNDPRPSQAHLVCSHCDEVTTVSIEYFVCLHCATEFLATPKQIKYCSRNCQLYDRTERRRAIRKLALTEGDD